MKGGLHTKTPATTALLFTLILRSINCSGLQYLWMEAFHTLYACYYVTTLSFIFISYFCSFENGKRVLLALSQQLSLSKLSCPALSAISWKQCLIQFCLAKDSKWNHDYGRWKVGSKRGSFFSWKLLWLGLLHFFPSKKAWIQKIHLYGNLLEKNSLVQNGLNNTILMYLAQSELKCDLNLND